MADDLFDLSDLSDLDDSDGDTKAVTSTAGGAKGRKPRRSGGGTTIDSFIARRKREKANKAALSEKLRQLREGDDSEDESDAKRRRADVQADGDAAAASLPYDGGVGQMRALAENAAATLGATEDEDEDPIFFEPPPIRLGPRLGPRARPCPRKPPALLRAACDGLRAEGLDVSDECRRTLAAEAVAGGWFDLKPLRDDRTAMLWLMGTALGVPSPNPSVEGIAEPMIAPSALGAVQAAEALHGDFFDPCNNNAPPSMADLAPTAVIASAARRGVVPDSFLTGGLLNRMRLRGQALAYAPLARLVAAGIGLHDLRSSVSSRGKAFALSRALRAVFFVACAGAHRAEGAGEKDTPEKRALCLVADYARRGLRFDARSDDVDDDVASDDDDDVVDVDVESLLDRMGRGVSLQPWIESKRLWEFADALKMLDVVLWHAASGRDRKDVADDVSDDVSDDLSDSEDEGVGFGVMGQQVKAALVPFLNTIKAQAHRVTRESARNIKVIAAELANSYKL